MRIAVLVAMDLRIVVSKKDSKTLVQVDGRLAAEGVPELEKVTRKAGPALCLDLSGLRLADDAGIVAIRHLRDSGAAIVGASPYIKLLLEE